MTYTQKIIEIIQEKHLTNYKICKDLGLPHQTIDNWKKGSKPNIEVFVQVIKYLGISANELFEIEDMPENERELLENFRNLPEREQIKWIGRLEDAAAQYKTSELEQQAAR